MTPDQAKSIFFANHRRVKRGFNWISDKDQFDKIEDWRVPRNPDDVDDDCDGHCLAVRFLCDKAGIVTHLVYCKLDGVGHLVLEHEGWISDHSLFVVHANTELEAKPNTFGTYRWISRSGEKRNDQWIDLEDENEHLKEIKA